jgi:hypothetical protein
MNDLDAIRARDAALIEENGYLFPPGEDYDSEPWRDRRALLAEVDALNEVVLALQQTVEREGAEVDRLQAELVARDAIGRADIAWDGGAAAERARIAEAVRGLPADWRQHPVMRETVRVAWVDRAAVLAVVEGER